MKKTWTIMLARFPYMAMERPEITEWCVSAAMWADKHPEIEGTLKFWFINDTPITMGRNRAVLAAINNKIDILVMCDSDMVFDIDRTHPFLPSAFDFIKSRWEQAPTIISAPYCTGAETYNPVMGTWRTYKDGYEVKAEVYTREEAAGFSGIQPCSLQGTGLMAIDMRVFTGFEVGGEVVKLPPPWFYYEYTDETNTFKASTEDMVFTRNVTLLFGKRDLEIAYVDWDAWAYHVKPQFVGKPHTLSIKTIAALHRE